MKKIILTALISFSTIVAFRPANAVELKFIGPCDESFIMKVDVSQEYKNVGQLTIETLKKFNIPHQGTPEGLASVFETPTGDESIEVISDVELRAYGWCFSVDGVSPEVYPHEVPVTAQTKSVVWHFGFARFYQGQWITQCTPAWKVKPVFLCADHATE